MIRQANIADVDVIRSVTRSAYAKWVPVLGREPKPMAADYIVAITLHRIDLLTVQNSVVALIEVVSEPSCLLIENIAVEPHHQRKGYGTRLLLHAERLAASAGFSRVRLYTNGRMLENIHYYEHFGYVIDGEEAVHDGTAVHMSKSI